MGEVIRPSAAVKDIFADGRTALTNAVAKGGKSKEHAEEGLSPCIALVDAIEAEQKTAEIAFAPLKAALIVGNGEADDAIQKIYDDTYNDVGRPGFDRYLSLMFPGGTVYYTDGDTTDQPARMELLAKLYDRNIHPKLSNAQSEAYAARVREAATALKTDIDAAAVPGANVDLLSRVRTSLGRIVAYELANLKRSYKNEGMTETEIHAIIPDRPTAKQAPKKTSAPSPDAKKPGDDPKEPK